MIIIVSLTTRLELVVIVPTTGLRRLARSSILAEERNQSEYVMNIVNGGQ